MSLGSNEEKGMIDISSGNVAQSVARFVQSARDPSNSK